VGENGKLTTGMETTQYREKGRVNRPMQGVVSGPLPEGDAMPYVNIRVTREGVTKAQKEALIQGATDLLVRVLAKDPATTVVVIDEVEMDNWGINGTTVTERRARAAAKK
jgi:4-oxalocrotonate tautomerase